MPVLRVSASAERIGDPFTEKRAAQMHSMPPRGPLVNAGVTLMQQRNELLVEAGVTIVGIAADARRGAWLVPAQSYGPVVPMVWRSTSKHLTATAPAHQGKA